jgi:hypothetical protein
VKERPSTTLAVVVQLTHCIPPRDVIRAVNALIGRHEALRARLAHDSCGNLIQEVLTLGDAAAKLALKCIELPAGKQADTVAERIDPEESAVRCTLFLRGDHVRAVKLSVSHVFTDAFGMQAVSRDLRAILHHDPLDPILPRQAGEYARGPWDPVIGANTQRWKDLLVDAPRSCTYSAVPREKYENEWHVWLPLATAHVGIASRELRATPYIIWSAIISSFVQLVSGQHRQVFRSTYANRVVPADFHAVAQLAQAVYLPIDGTSEDTFRTRVAQISRVTFLTLRWGDYDTIGMLDWLNDAVIARGAIFQPAFELNYLPPARGEKSDTRPAEAEIQETLVRIDPPSAKADFAVSVVHKPSPAARFSIRRPVGRQRGAEEVAADCLTVMRTLCEYPDQMIKDVPVRPFTEELLPGHHSGMAVAPKATCDLVRSFPGVASCAVEMSRDGKLIAHMSASRPIRTDVMLRALRNKQPWLSGSVVPDHFDITY